MSAFVIALIVCPLVVAVACAVVLAYALYAKRGEFFDSNGVPIHYTVEGQGEPLVLIHGFAVNADLNWRKVGIIKTLARHYRVVAFDMRGHGRSGKPHDMAQYGIEMVYDVIRLMDHLGIEKAHVAGYSLGGFITLKLVAAHPERVLSAAVCAAGWIRPTEENLALVQMVKEGLEHGQGILPLMNELDPVDRRPFPGVKFIVNTFVSATNDAVALACCFGSISAIEVLESELRAIVLPVLTIVGGSDPLKSSVDALQGLLRNHRTVIIDRADHGTAAGRREFIRELAAFLRDHRRPSAPVGNPVPGQVETSA